MGTGQERSRKIKGGEKDAEPENSFSAKRGVGAVSVDKKGKKKRAKGGQMYCLNSR